MGDDRPPRYIDGDTIVYRASSLGMCERALIACARGVPAVPWPAKFQEVLDEGTRMEGEISQMWDDESDCMTVDSQLELELEVGESAGKAVIVRAHIDGWYGRAGTPVLREFKKFRDSTWSSFLTKGIEVHINYPWQVSVMMHAGGFDECEFVGGHVVDGELTEVHRKLITQPPFSYKAIRQRVMRIEKMINAGLDVQDVDCREDYPCRWYKVHDEKPVDDTFTVPDNDIGKLAAQFAADLANVSAEIRRLEADKKDWSKGLKAALEELGAEGQKKVKAGDWVVTHVVKQMPERVIKAGTQDYYTVKKET